MFFGNYLSFAKLITQEFCQILPIMKTRFVFKLVYLQELLSDLIWMIVWFESLLINRYSESKTYKQ